MIDVVIVDDEIWVARMVTRIIDWQAMGFRIAGVFQDGEEGLREILRLRPRLVLTDIRMPGKSGLDIIREVSAAAADTLFVIISGYSDFEYAKAALTYGAIGYLLKPIDQKELEKVVLKARQQIASEQTKRQAELSLKSSMGQTVEALREQFFINCFEGLGDRTESLGKINADLKLNFQPACFQVVSLSVEQAARLRECQELVTRVIWEVELPTECLEMTTLTMGESIVFVLNFPERQEEALQRTLEQLFRRVLEKRPACGLTMGIGTVAGQFFELSDSYRASQEMTMARLIWGQNRLYTALKQPRGGQIDSQTGYLSHDVSLKQGFDSGDLDAVQNTTKAMLDRCLIRAQKEPALLLRELNHLLDLYCDSAPADTADWQGYFREKRRMLGGVSSLAEVRAILTQAARDILNSRESREQGSGRTAVQEVLRYIDKNYMQDLSLGEISELVHLNPNYFCEVFKREVGVTFKEYLTNRRMEKAKELLKNPAFKLNEVAALTGYSDARHFGKSFKRLTGVTPKEYRKLMVGYG